MEEPIKYREGFVAVPTWTSIENPELDRLRNEAAFAELVCEMAHRVNGEHLATDDVIRATGVELRDMVRSLEDGHRFAAELADLRRDRETLRKIREVVNRPTVSQDNLSVYSMWCTALFEEIQQLVREQEQEKGDV